MTTSSMPSSESNPASVPPDFDYQSEIARLHRIESAARAYRDHEEAEPDSYRVEHVEWESLLYERQHDLDVALGGHE